MKFKLLYRVLERNWEDKEDSFVSSDGINVHEGNSINLVIGMTGSGKTSMIQILAGGDQTFPRTKSETQDPVLVFDEVNDILWLDTAGMCDSSDDSLRKALLRDAILDAVKEYRFSVGCIFVCVASDQNLDVKFAHEFVAFKAALPGSDLITRVVITKVNRTKTANQINAVGGLKAKYASAFNCPVDRVLLHGYGSFNADVLLHTVGLRSGGGIHHDQIGIVTENTQLAKMIQDLNSQLKKSNSLMDKNLSDKEQVEHKLQELYKTVAAAEETLDHLLSTNTCGRNNGAIRSAHDDISRFRAELIENEHKLSANKIAASQVSYTSDRLNSEILKTKNELEARMKEGLVLATLAGAATSFLSFFGK
ncbi:hypothetical protein ACHAW6_008328 [Cyclotella cf. meneghiniana]